MAEAKYVYKLMLVFFTDMVDENGKPIGLMQKFIQFDNKEQFDSACKQMAEGKRWIVIDYGKNKLPMTINLGNDSLAWAQPFIQQERKESVVLTTTGDKQLETVQ